MACGAGFGEEDVAWSQNGCEEAPYFVLRDGLFAGERGGGDRSITRKVGEGLGAAYWVGFEAFEELGHEFFGWNVPEGLVAEPDLGVCECDGRFWTGNASVGLSKVSHCHASLGSFTDVAVR